MTKGYYWLFLSFIFVLVLAACGDSGSDEGDTYDYEDFNQSVSNTSEPSGEGTLRIGYSMDTPFEGTFNWAFYSLGPDADILELFDESVFTFNENRQATNASAIEYEMNEEDNTVTFTVKDDVTWHDGEPLKIQDYIFSYEVIGHPDYERGTWKYRRLHTD